MSDLSAIPQEHVDHAIASAMFAGCDCDPGGACDAVVSSLSASFGPIIQQIIEIIKTGVRNLPAILAALQAAGVVLPPWVNLIITILLKIIPAA
jgi:hypothetical protein